MPGVYLVQRRHAPQKRYLSFLNNYRELVTTPTKRHVLVALASAYVLVQVGSFPVALSIPDIADAFDISVASASWVIIAELLALGTTVFLAARLGDRHGHHRVFYLGVIITTIGGTLAGFSGDIAQLVVFRSIQGLGAAFITGNANAILAETFPSEERGRAFAIPITGARIGTFVGLITFALFLQFASWRFVFYSFIPLGFAALWACWPLLKDAPARTERAKVPLDYLGASIFIGAIAAMILSGMHLHDGDESFTSEQALNYHVPMHLLFLALLGLFIVVEGRVRHPFLDFSLFRYKQFTLAIFSNTTFHLSMLAVFTLIPIMVEKGFGYDPILVIYVLLPMQILGVFVPVFAGWYYDRYHPRLMRPISMTLIALGLFLLGMFALKLPIWYLPLLMLPASVGTAIFNTINNAVIMNSMPQEHRGFASGMIETTRQVGHTIGATIAASAVGLVLPAAIEFLEATEAQEHYLKGMQAAALFVVWIILAGAITAYFHRPIEAAGPAPAAQPSASGGGN